MQPSFISLPLPWNQQLISILPDKDKLVLFKTCHHWAQQVVQHTARTTLRLGKRYREGPPPPAAQVNARRRVITHLLRGSRDINMVLQEYVNSPFPNTLCNCITAIKMDCSSPDGLPSIPWEDLISLKHLSVGSMVRSGGVTELCQVLEAGHMPQLCELGLHVEAGAVSSPKASFMHWLAVAVGPRIEHLTTNSSELLHHLQCFTKLQSAKFEWGHLSDQAGRQLCSHPTLQHVTFRHCWNLDGYHQHSKCSWETLTLQDCRPQIPARLPIEHLKEIKILNSINDLNELFDETDRMALASVKLLLGGRIVCGGTGGSFRLCDVSYDTLHLVRSLRDVQRLCLQHTWGGCCVLQQPKLDMQHKALLYAALPPCIQHITFVSVKNLDWEELWQGMPGTVHSVSICNCDVCANDARALIQAAPVHITRINLRESYVTADKGYVEGNNKRAVEWQAVGLQAMEPAHLT